MLSSAAAIAAIAIFGAPAAQAALCLPPVFEGGERLHARDESRVEWLEILFRQHEVCWRAPASQDERRVFLTGASGIYGFPLSADRAVGGQLNRLLDASGVPARVFNLAHVYTYQVKDALLIRHALDYAPDLLVHAINLDDFTHRAPNGYEPIARFFADNAFEVSRLKSERPAGLSEPLDRYYEQQAALRSWRGVHTALRQLGSFVRLGARELGRRLLALWSPTIETAPPRRRSDDYQCADVRAQFEDLFDDWTSWNIVAYLEEIQRERGVDVLLVNWPVAHEPRGDCYNVRFTDQALRTYNVWVGEEARKRGIRFVDLHDALGRDDFLDSYHPNPRGHRRLAERLVSEIEDALAERETRFRCSSGRLPP